MGIVEIWLVGVAFGFMFSSGVYFIGFSFNVIYKFFK